MRCFKCKKTMNPSKRKETTFSYYGFTTPLDKEDHTVFECTDCNETEIQYNNINSLNREGKLLAIEEIETELKDKPAARALLIYLMNHVHTFTDPSPNDSPWGPPTITTNEPE